MNYRFIFYVLGVVELILGIAVLISSGVGYIYSDPASYIMLTCGIILTFLGLLIYLLFRKTEKLANNKTILMLVVITWFVMCLSGSLPYYLSGVFTDYSLNSFINSLFESTSGFTTTGSSVLGNPYPIESLGKGILFWRSFTHWIGGIGIVLMVLSVLPMLGSAGMQLFKAESPGAVISKIHPRMISTARALGFVYLILTVLLTIFYLFGGLSLFDSVCTTFGAIATGGFSVKDASIAGFHSSYVEWVTIIFLFIGATNFSLHYSFMKGNPGKYLKSSEFKFYVIWILSGIVLVSTIVFYSAEIRSVFDSTTDLIRTVAFQVTSLSTATGYVTTDYDVWPSGVKAFFLIMMVFGGCVGSTAGGIKMFRLLILIKYAFREIRRVLQPSLFVAVKYDKEVVQRGVIEGISSFFILYALIFLIASSLIAVTGINVTDSISAVVTTLGGVGPGFGFVGPAKNFFFISPVGKVILIFCMLFGRLEIVPLAALLTPTFWRK